MDRKRKKWTEEEDSVVVSLMEEYHGDVCKVATIAAPMLGRTPMAVAGRWYGKLQPRKGSARAVYRKRVAGDAVAVCKDSFIVRLIKFLFRR